MLGSDQAVVHSLPSNREYESTSHWMSDDEFSALRSNIDLIYSTVIRKGKKLSFNCYVECLRDALL